MDNKSLFQKFFFFSIVILLTACGGGGDSTAQGEISSAARTSILSANDSDCPNGGILVETGIDENANGLLESSEVDSSQKVCNGENGSNGIDGNDGLSALIKLSSIPSGAICLNGGLQVDTGIDDNANGTLDSAEIDDSQVICQGQDGANGSNGSDGLNSLIAMSDEPSGANCEFGGTRIESGIDNNGNGSLENSEVTDTRFLCALSSSSFDGLVYSTDPNISSMSELFRTSNDSNASSKLAGPKSVSNSIGSFKVSPDHTQVAFIADLETKSVMELYVISLIDGSAPIRVSDLLTSGKSVAAFEWSPDGSRLAYVANQESSAQELYSVFPDGSGNIKLSIHNVVGSDVLNRGFKWSPNSSHIAYMADQDTNGVWELYSVLPDGSANTKISGPMVTGGNVLDEAFQWSPDSQFVAYIADQDTRFLQELYVSSLAGGTNIRVSIAMTTSSFGVSDFRWSPDSNHIAYRADSNTSYADLFSATADGVSNINISAPLYTSGNTVSASYQWAPDSSRIIFDLSGALYSSLPDGASAIKISADTLGINSLNQGYQWAPDSSRVAYIADQASNTINELYSVLPDGTGNLKISAPLATGIDVQILQWAPDSNHIAYLTDQTGGGKSELFSALPDAGSSGVKVSGNLISGGFVGYDFKWSPDSTRIAYVATQDTLDRSELYTSLADGTGNIKVSGTYQVNVSASGFRFSW